MLKITLKLLIIAFYLLLNINNVNAQNLVTEEMLTTAQEDPNNWLMVTGNYTGNRYSKLGQINESNVSKLVPKWIFSLGTLDAQNTTPVIHNGIMYVTASHGKTYALNAANGQEIWRYSHQLPECVAGKMIFKTIAKGRKGTNMVGWESELENNEIWEIIIYIRSIYTGDKNKIIW